MSASPEEYRDWYSLGDDFKKMCVHSALLDPTVNKYTFMRQSSEAVEKDPTFST